MAAAPEPEHDAAVPVQSVMRGVLYAPYLAVFYPFLLLRRAHATLRPASGGTWRTWISPSLCVGGFLLPGDVAELAAEGVSAIVNITRELVEPRATIESAGLAYLQIPCWDGHVPTIEEGRRGVRFIAERVAEGKKVYVHCASGVGRSVMLLLCYLAEHEGKDVNEAHAAIKRARPRVKLSRAQRAFVEAYLAAS